VPAPLTPLIERFSFQKTAIRLLASALLPAMAEVIMSVLARIQIVGAVVMSITAALVLFGTFWLVSFFDVFPEIHSRWVVGALLSGLPLLSFLCLVLALSIDAGQRRLQRTRDSNRTLSEGGTFEAPPWPAGRSETRRSA
jgi:apolipoprotein N-acyltransferase